ncbi:hypothetical protein H5410_004128 [Solanum commersonii]|uniref:Uncharacterized protein n=1 Tax=Solanum commersonii TaxID=4109 RepID=A0A9J6B728_SOLCO|nr:hypothetical protein H5410_004128 [Solanum commersonii]
MRASLRGSQPPPVALLPPPSSSHLISSLLSLLPPVSSHRREWRDKSLPLSHLSNQRKFTALSLPQLLRPASSKQSTLAAGEESNNISGQLTPTSIQCPSPLIEAEALDGVQIAAMSNQIAKLTAALVESERKRVDEQQSMSETVQQIKEQVMNLARRPTTSAPDDTDDESDEDDYVDLTL